MKAMKFMLFAVAAMAAAATPEGLTDDYLNKIFKDAVDECERRLG